MTNIFGIGRSTRARWTSSRGSFELWEEQIRTAGRGVYPDRSVWILVALLYNRDSQLGLGGVRYRLNDKTARSCELDRDGVRAALERMMLRGTPRTDEPPGASRIC